MKQVNFCEVTRNAWFFDKFYSGEWMRKVDDCTARFQDGLLGLVDPTCPVFVEKEQ